MPPFSVICIRKVWNVSYFHWKFSYISYHDSCATFKEILMWGLVWWQVVAVSLFALVPLLTSIATFLFPVETQVKCLAGPSYVFPSINWTAWIYYFIWCKWTEWKHRILEHKRVKLYVRPQRHSIMESLIINGAFLLTGATAGRRYSVAKVRKPLSAIATATINGNQLVILCTIYLTLNGDNCWRWQSGQAWIEVSHFPPPFALKPKTDQLCCFVQENKQTNQTALMLFLGKYRWLNEGVGPLSYLDKWFCQCNKKKKSIMSILCLFLFFFCFFCLFVVWCLTNMCWVSWERNEIKEAQGVSKSRRLMGAVFHFDLWRKNQQILVD